MSELRDIIKDIQKEVGVEVDGIAGRVTLINVLAALRERHMDLQTEKEWPARVAEAASFDERTEKILAGLDAKAVPVFRRFLARAQATAATLGCEYKLISGHRTWEEQDALYAQGRFKSGKIVTKAKGGQSNHNFGIAADAGVFLGRIYLDGGSKEQQALAAKVHRACSEHAAACGLEWGGSWTSFKDLPHYEVWTGLTMAGKRSAYKEKGSVL